MLKDPSQSKFGQGVPEIFAIAVGLPSVDFGFASVGDCSKTARRRKIPYLDLDRKEEVARQLRVDV